MAVMMSMAMPSVLRNFATPIYVMLMCYIDILMGVNIIDLGFVVGWIASIGNNCWSGQQFHNFYNTIYHRCIGLKLSL